MTNEEIKKTQDRFRAVANTIHNMTSAVAEARQVKEFISDQRKNVLAKHTLQFLADNSAAAAETLARSSDGFIKDFAQLETSYRDAEKILADWSALQVKFEALRSLLSMEKETLRNLQG